MWKLVNHALKISFGVQTQHMTAGKWLQAILLWTIYLPIVGSTWLTVWLDRKLRFKLPFPRDVEELAKWQNWCIAELKAGGAIPAQAVVTGYRVTPMDAKLIFRSDACIVDIDYTLDTTIRHLRCFAKFAPTMGTVWNKTGFNLQLNHIKEINFNNLFAKADAGLPAPQVYVAKVSELTGHLCLITEFMTGCIEHKDSIYKDFTDEHLEQAVNGLAQLHARYWLCTEERMKKVLAIEDSTVLLFETMIARSWTAQAQLIMRNSWKHCNAFQTVVHGDARIGNMMFARDSTHGRFVLFDWQAVRKGVAVYDLAYFLILSLAAEHRLQVEAACLQQYYKRLTALGVTNYTYQQLTDDYNHASLCVLTLLSLPLLSGEASAEGEAAEVFKWGMGVWRDRLKSKFEGFDYGWVQKHYGLTEEEARRATGEMVDVITKRIA